MQPRHLRDVPGIGISENIIVFGWALTFLLLALVAGYMGFFALAGATVLVAKLLLVVFLVLLVVSGFSGVLSSRPPV
jgi:uncharacterized membrane protein YtjA (UPF0391 family)